MAHSGLSQLLQQLEQVLLGKPRQIRLALACILARGHLLIEDLPGMGKTSLSHALAQSLGLSYQRIQFTSDMLPADILGVSIFDKHQAQFVFHPGPIFKQMVLADEINRASPKTQSALLEAMAEQQISVDGITHRLPNPFFVIATQNPTEQSGTFPLPESQLDRFMMRISIGYPSHDAELAMLKTVQTPQTLDNLPQCLTPLALTQLQEQCDKVTASDALLNYILALIHDSRSQTDAIGLSPRATKALLQAAKAWAFLEGRHYLVPEDVQAVFCSVAEHRLRTSSQLQGEALSERILAGVNPIM
ncbi:MULTISPECIES: AAA family ATPase [Shewanella]|uniref:AAA family ATPase n=1 Tax=Shewanella xiamenensis TaxID=332186 RepID=A0AAW6QWB2_9GAMM|nr:MULTISPECIES: AAA family ATPase [Shewanella]NMD52347.1 AAA domain-containing protein [Shewanella sp. DNRA4]PZP37870.1 MAG: AAA family ATPase [Shewanella oneidensis]ASF14190.1 AAA family ATPase [Shewanella sp. FDAARGOS_354]KPN75779.1 ATPase AAA [Shewanella sp. Sh95]MBW0281678.1 AAA family ATPase [Shewanella xiamenensis]